MNNVCTNQTTFNVAFREALKDMENRREKKARPWVIVSVTLFLVFFVWALLLAMTLPPSADRTVHLVFALTFSPIYVISHYLGQLSNGDVKMGMRRYY